MAERTRDWKDILGDGPVNEARVRLYRQLSDARDRIAQTRYAAGVSDDVVQAALDAADERLTDDERREDLYLSSLTHYVDALGGRLELRAVFDDDAIVVRREPGG